jgi:two-component system OmpR family response regulator
MRILVVEDEARLATLLRKGLMEEGHAVDLAGCGEEALDRVADTNYDVIVLDIMLPGIDGFAVCRHLRQDRVQTPILLLTARDAVCDRIAGLDVGADDYLIKPFAFAELVARLRALYRRPAQAVPTVLKGGSVTLDPASRRVWRGANEVFLPKKEFRILEYMMRQPGRIVTRAMIAEHAWDSEFLNVTNVIDVHVRQLRSRLGDPFPGELIQTVRGSGYRFTTDP